MSDKPDLDPQLHLTFVEFLFSLAAAEIALRFAYIFDQGADWYSWGFVATVSHLAMAMILIAASYIGWSRSQSSHRDTRLVSVLSWDFVELLLDVTLVIAYFVLVHLSEEPDKTHSGAGPAPIAVSLIPEAICIPAIFALYVVWDCVSKFPGRLDPKSGHPFGADKLCERGWISVLLMILSAAVSFICWTPNATASQVIAFDVAMIGLVVLFRELKEGVANTKQGFGNRCYVFGRPKVLVAILIVLAPLMILKRL
ncbi:MAG: hypothetical protein ACO1RT_13180 [Planctomycetaceae bacterium]